MGTGVRECLRSSCKVAQVPFFFKQWDGVRKKQAGRELDGKIYDEFPPVRRAAFPTRQVREQTLTCLTEYLSDTFAR